MAEFNSSGAAAGATAGSSFGPWGAVIGGVVGGFGGKGGSGAGSGGYVPQSAGQAVYGGMGLDGSGWNVNFGGVQSNGSNKQGQPASGVDPLPGMAPAGPGLGGVSPLVLAAGVGLIGIALWRRKKSS